MHTDDEQKGVPKAGEGRWANNHIPTERSEFYRQRIAARVRGEDPGYSPVVFGKCERTKAGVLQGGDLSLARALDEALKARKAEQTR